MVARTIVQGGKGGVSKAVVSLPLIIEGRDELGGRSKNREQEGGRAG